MSVPDEHALAALMGSHPRMGQASPLRALDPGLLVQIVCASMPPVAERTIYCHRNYSINDTVMLSRYDRPRSCYVCTILDDGVLVFRGALPHMHCAQFTYTSRPKGGARVRFGVCLELLWDKPIAVTEWIYNPGITVLQGIVRVDGVSELEAFRAANEIGIELRLSMTMPAEVEHGPWTPIAEK